MKPPEFNAEQAAAIEHSYGPLRIMAGAGTGKTFTLTHRIARLIEQGLATPSQILALTFTNKAVDELRERIDPAVARLAINSERVDIDTYHAFGGRIASEFGLSLGLPPEPMLLTPAESWIVLWRAVDEIDFQHIDLANLRGGLGGSPLHEIINLGSRLRDELRTLDDLWVYLNTLDADDGDANLLRDYARGLEVYEAKKRVLGAIDFGDQIALACKLLGREQVARTITERYRFVLVDEFQDTNYSQSMMVQRLVDPGTRNICVVGDPNQAIYAFRGAAPDTMDRFANEVFRDTATQPLSTNYRSTQAILDVANSVWESDPGPFRGNLVANSRDHGVRPSLVEGEMQADEVAYIASEIRRLVVEEGFAFSQIAVIVRKNQAKRDLWKQLREYGIPAEATGEAALFDTPEVRELVSYLRVIADHRHDASFAHVLMTDRWGLDERALHRLASKRIDKETLQETARRTVGDVDTPTALTACLTALERLSQRSYAGIEPVLDSAIGLRQGGYDELEAANVERFANLVRSFGANRVDRPNLEDLVVYLNLLLNAGPEEEAATDLEAGTADTVKILTAHAAKGLQWPVVFVATANKQDFLQSGVSRRGALPDALARPSPGRPVRGDFGDEAKGDRALDKALKAWRKEQSAKEELRVLYVALTRAEKRLYLTWSRKHPIRTREYPLHPALEPAVEHCTAVNAPVAEPLEQRETIGSFVGAHFSALTSLLSSPAEGASPALTVDWIADGGLRDALQNGFAQFSAEHRTVREHISFIQDYSMQDNLNETEPGDDLFSVSFTQLETFAECPHRYYLRFMLGIPGAPRQWATGYGSALHRALAGEAEKRRLGIRSTAADLRASVELDPDWQPTTNWQPTTKGSAVSSEVLLDPIDVYLSSVDASAELLLIEEEFTLRFGEIAVNGVIDRVQGLADGSTEVVDYKSDRTVRTPENVRDGLQLPIYLVACREIFTEIKPPPNRAVMFFLRHNERIEQTYSQDDLARVRDRVVETATRMRNIDPSDHNASPEACRWCDFRQTCEFAVSS